MMSDETLYRLGESTAVEPLVNNWVAWSHVISPVASSLHLQNYQIDVLQSYLKDPKMHVDACRTPRLRSGRYVNIPEFRVPEVRAFLAETEVKQQKNLQFAKSLINFHNYLVQKAKGHSLESYYAELPSELRGYVELVYDYYNRPTVRFFESLLYESDYFDTSLHSLRLFRQTHDTSRPFFMNTPRLPAKGQIRWEVPFESPLIDELFKLDSAPKPLGHLREMLDLKPADEEVLLPLLSADPYCARKKREGSGVFINYLGHACVLIEWNGISILTDPCIGLKPVKGGVERFTYKDLPEKLDYVLITHNHHDHFCLESLLRLRHKIDCLVVPRSFGILYGDLSLKLLAKKVGFKNVVELETLESIKLSDGEIIAIPFMGEHADLSHGKTAYVVRAGSTQTLFAADSDCLDVQMYQHIYRVLGPIQTVFLGMECVGAPLSWSCGAFLPCKPEHSINQSRRYKGCDSTRGLSILEAVGAQRIYIYAMGLEPWLEYLLGLAYTAEATQIKEAQKLLSAARERGFSDAQLLTNKAEIHLMNHA
jgi:L-ascorbate metabolism protein UlaG (beta-lactamase superfamily)